MVYVGKKKKICANFILSMMMQLPKNLKIKFLIVSYILKFLDNKSLKTRKNKLKFL